MDSRIDKIRTVVLVMSEMDNATFETLYKIICGKEVSDGRRKISKHNKLGIKKS